NERRREPYDALLIATGAHPVMPELPGVDEYVHVVRTLDEAQVVRGYLDTHDVRHAVVIGAGYIGIEIAEAMVRRGVDCTLVDRSPHVLAGTLDAQMAGHLHEPIQDFGVTLALGQS